MQHSKDNDNKIIIWGGIVTFLIICLWIVTYLILKDEKPEIRGTLGDMFGTVNALFSGLALSGIIFTILLQRKELSYQRDELRETRKEFIIQNKTLTIQRFENTFFNLLTIHNNIVNSLDHETNRRQKIQGQTSMNSVIISGRDVFELMYENYHNEFNRMQNIDTLNTTYLKLYKDVQADFGHYFRGLYRIIKFINETEFVTYTELEINKDTASDIEKSNYNLINDKIKYNYTSMVRSQLSDYELVWLFYNCLSDLGSEKFKPLIESFSLLKTLPKDLIINQKLLNEYSDTAYNKKNYG